MAMRLGEKAERVLKFLVGLRYKRIARRLAAYGFTDDDRVEGWQLLQGIGGGKHDLVPLGPVDVSTFERLDAWENRWFVVASAALERHFPDVYEQVFLNLSQTEGPEVAVTVQTFVKRYDAMSRAEGPYAAEGPKAQALLAKRGLTPAVIDHARALLAELGRVAESDDVSDPEDERAELQRAEDAMWGWYLEWSRVARVAITQRSLLRQLGFLQAEASEREEEGEEGVAEETTSAAVKK